MHFVKTSKKLRIIAILLVLYAAISLTWSVGSDLYNHGFEWLTLNFVARQYYAKRTLFITLLGCILGWTGLIMEH